MSGRSIEHRPLTGHAPRPETPPPIASGLAAAPRGALRQTLADLLECWGRVLRKTRMPSREGVVAFLGNQVLVNTVAWTAGVLAAALVRSFFEVKGVRNLWGLTASRHRSLVSADDYHLIMTLASYAAGLLMLILMRHLVLRLVAEFHALRRERARGAGARAAVAPEAPVSERSAAGAGTRAAALAAAGGRRSAAGAAGASALELLVDDPLED